MIKDKVIKSSLAVIIMLSASCVNVKTAKLYEDIPNPQENVFYSSSEIYADYITSEAWVTLDQNCISAKAIPEAAYKGDLGLHVKWNRTLEGCPWLGMGFGWDEWTGKDLSEIKNIAAIEFHVRMLEGSRGVLPWAVGLEDFTGSQAWLGMSSNAIKAEKITTEWTRIELPLSEFNWEEQDANFANIKQMIITFEADGEILMDEIRIVPYSGGFRKRVTIEPYALEDFNVDGLKNDKIWDTEEYKFGENKVHLALDGDFLLIAMETKDEDPMQNNNKAKDSYNGDCFELAFSTDVLASPKRTNYLSTDRHLGFVIGEEISVYEWQLKKQIENVIAKAQKTDSSYVFEAILDLKTIEIEGLDSKSLYGLEMAVDHGNEKGRYRQDRWNNQNTDQFYKNPSLWGEMYISGTENQ